MFFPPLVVDKSVEERSAADNTRYKADHHFYQGETVSPYS